MAVAIARGVVVPGFRKRATIPHSILRQHSWRRECRRLLKHARTPSEILTGRCAKCKHFLLNHPRAFCILCRCSRREGRRGWGRKIAGRGHALT